MKSGVGDISLQQYNVLNGGQKTAASEPSIADNLRSISERMVEAEHTLMRALDNVRGPRPSSVEERAADGPSTIAVVVDRLNRRMLDIVNMSEELAQRLSF